jgi:histidyl-tRNA synthetase
VETFGMSGPDLDAELIMMTARLWKKLNLEGLELQLNSLGTVETRRVYRDKLVEYFNSHKNQLDEDSQRRLNSNPLRILDSKNPEMKSLIEGAPKLIEYIDSESREHFDDLCGLLNAVGVSFRVNPCLVRGLDYYSRTVFEWVTDKLGAQGTVCAGGRFDGLVEHLGGKSIPAAGFAMGMERLLELVKNNLFPDHLPHAYLVLVGETAQKDGVMLAEKLRDDVPGLRLLVHCGGGSFKSQFKKADRSGAQVALVLGNDEIVQDAVGVKHLRQDIPQVLVKKADLSGWIMKNIIESA